MTLIRTTCPRCGEVEMTAEAILLSVRHPSGDAQYRFMCPTCMDPVEKRADRKIVALLLSAGVDLAEASEPRPAQTHLELEPIETLTGRFGSPFTPDDLLEFHFLLQDDARLARELLSG